MSYDTGARYKGKAIILDDDNPYNAVEFLHWIEDSISQNPNLPRAQFDPIVEATHRVLVLRPKRPSDHAGVLLDMLVERLATSEDFEAIKRDVQAVLDSYHESKKPKPNGHYFWPGNAADAERIRNARDGEFVQVESP